VRRLGRGRLASRLGAAHDGARRVGVGVTGFDDNDVKDL
jgi:hypothetical protein